MASWQPAERKLLRSKEELKIMIPQDIANKISFEEDPINCYIKVDATSLGYFEWYRFLQSLPSINQKYGVPKLKAKFSLKGVKYVYSYPYKPATEKEARTLELAGRLEDAAKEYELLGMFEKAGSLRRMGQTQYIVSTSFHLGANGVIKINCPHCGASSAVTEKSGNRVCEYCKQAYVVPQKVLDML
jgi:hypothetical protein